MYSKHIFILLCLLGLVGGCSLRLDDKVTKPSHSVNTGANCLSQAADVMERFNRGELSEAEHDAFYSCINKAFTTFADFADGKSEDFFEPAELSQFLTKYFLNGKVVSPALLAEAMALKRAVIGGDLNRLSRQELRRTIQLTGEFQKFSGSLRTVMPFSVSSFVARKFNSDQFEDAMRRLIMGMERLGNGIKNGQGEYQLDRFAGLIRELRAFLYGNEVPANSWTNTMLRLANTLPAAKGIFISPPRHQISVSDWPKVYRLAPRYLASLFRAQFYLLSPMQFVREGGLQRLELFFADFVENFDYVIDQHANQEITSEEIENLVNVLHAEKLITFRPDTALSFIKILFGKLLGEAADPAKFSVSKKSLSHFKDGVRYTFEGLHAIETLYQAKHGEKYIEGSLSRSEITAFPVSKLLESTLLKNRLSMEAVEDVKRTPVELRTVFSGRGFSMSIPKKGRVEHLPYLHMLKVHGLRSLNRLLISVYGDAGRKRLTEKQLQSFLDDLFPILTELELLDENARKSVPKRLFEASLFLYSSDGDQGLTMNEAIEFEVLLLSTLERAGKVFKSFSATCKSGRNDEKGASLLSSDCFRRTFLAKTATIWSYIPGLADYMSIHTEREQADLFAQMEKFLRKDKKTTDDFSQSDTQSFILLPYYVELLFSRFDKNHDGFLDNAEADTGYPVFQPFIAAKSLEKGFKNPKDHKAVFNFLLAYRKIPTDSKLSYAFRRYVLGPKNFRVDRGQVIEIFSKLMSL